MKKAVLLLWMVFIFFSCKDSNQNIQTAEPSTDSWAISTLEAEGLSKNIVDSIHGKIEAGDYGYIDKLVIVKNGKLVFNESYPNNYREISKGFSGTLGCGYETCQDSSEIGEYNYFHPDIHPYYRGRKVHSLQSVTKSVAATVVGIAIDKGYIKSVDEPVLSFFEGYNLDKASQNLKDAPLKYLLSMELGMEWHEQDRPLDSTNTTLQLETSEDWIQFTLDQPMDAEPGEKWVYNSGASHLMSGIIKKATGQYIDEYANEHLFTPLGIKDFHWKKTPKGYPDTEGGLFLEAEDLAKIGYLYLNNGKWGDKQILSEEWVNAAVGLQAENINQIGWGYGYQWWRLDQEDKEVWAGLGFGGQFLLVIPDDSLVFVVNSWNLFGGQNQNILGTLLNTFI